MAMGYDETWVSFILNILMLIVVVMGIFFVHNPPPNQPFTQSFIWFPSGAAITMSIINLILSAISFLDRLDAFSAINLLLSLIICYMAFISFM